MLTDDKYLELENEFDTSKITFEGKWIYPVIKQGLLLPKLKVYDKKSSVISSQKSSLWVKIFFDFFKYLRNIQHQANNAEYLFFDSTTRRRLQVNGKSFSIYSDSFIEALNTHKSIVVEEGRPSFPFYESKNYGKTYFESFGIDLVHLKTKLRKRKIDYSIYEKLFDHFEVKVTPNELNSFFTKIKYLEKHYTYVLNKFKPRAIFLVCAYEYKRMVLVSVARELKIPVIEIQHGNIYRSHLGYAYKQNFGNHYFPEYLLAYGPFFRNEILTSSKLFKPDQIIVTGSSFIDFYDHGCFPLNDRTILDFIKNKKVLLFTGQQTVHKLVQTFFTNLLEILPPDFVILFKPHPGEIQPDLIYKSILQHPKIKLIENENILSVLKISDFHSTIYSTTFYEATYYKIPTIFIYSERYSKSILQFIDNKSIYLAKTPRNMVDLLLRSNHSPVKLNGGREFYAEDSKTKVTEFMRKLGL